MPSVSHSEVESYTLCRRKQYYGYALGIERATTSTSLGRGSAGHAVLEAFYNAILEAGDDPADQRASFDYALSKAWEKYNELAKRNTFDDDSHLDLKAIMFDWYFPNEPFVRKGWQVLAVEAEFNLEYDEVEHLTYPFVVDLIAYDPDGNLVVIDHKFLFDFYSWQVSQLQPQIPKYIGALRALNYPIAYGAYNMLRTRPLKVKTKNTALDRVEYMEIRPTNLRVVRTFEEQIGVSKEIMYRKTLQIDTQEKLAYRVANNMVSNS
jgi:hypothetical protein